MRETGSRCIERAHPWRAAAVAASLLVSVTCGGGGPTAPPPIPPGPPVSGNVQGSVVGLSDASASFEGTQVRIVGVGQSTIDASNRWGIEGVPPGIHQLELSGSSHLRRRLEIRVEAGGVNHFDGLVLVEPAPFNLSAFDEIYRSFAIPGTIRWSQQPTRVVLDRKSLSSLDQGLGFFESEVRSAFTGWLSDASDGFFDGTPVVKGSIPVPDLESFSCDDVSEGEIYIVGYDFDCTQALGWESHCIDSIGNAVSRAVIWLSDCSTQRTIIHELIHTLCAGHLDTMAHLSIMGGSGFGAPGITSMDSLHMRYLYDRPPGVGTPDDAWGLPPLEPRVAATGSSRVTHPSRLGTTPGDDSAGAPTDPAVEPLFSGDDPGVGEPARDRY